MKFHNKWTKIRKLGLRKYTLKQLLHTALLFVVVALLIFLLGYKEFAINYFTGGLLGSSIGIIIGAKSKWIKNEKRFQLTQNVMNEKFT